jgi:hypothetical protein
VDRLLAFVRTAALDKELADGLRPASSHTRELRADRLKQGRVRHRIAAALDRAIGAARIPSPALGSMAPLNREAILACADELHALANSIATAVNPRAQGLAMASLLAFDGAGPLFWRPGEPDASQRLPNAIQAIKAALRVSAEFDSMGPEPRLGD